MKKLTDLEYLRLSPEIKLLYKILQFFMSIPLFFKRIGLAIWNGIKKTGMKIKDEAVDIVMTFIHGSWKTKVSYLIMGFGSLARGQILRGLLFLLFEGVFVFYMIVSGVYWLRKFVTLGDVPLRVEVDPIYDVEVEIPGDNSFKILLYGLLTILFIIAFIYTWRVNIKQNKISEQIIASGKKIKSGRDDLRSLVDDQFHKTLLALPMTGILIFTVIPILFMILVAFTNYQGTTNDGYKNLFTWVGLQNFNELFHIGTSDGRLSFTFGEILSWTLIWAVFATFTNYFLGMLVAIMINKKGIKFKKFWRNVLVLTIAVPQFVSLLYVSRLFSKNGLVNSLLMKLSLTSTAIDFWNNPTYARILVIVINIWIGIPYLMLIATGILMNIPQDLYESSKIDGANVWQQYRKITLPYMLFVTGPYLLTSFIANINNFNVIYLLTYGQTMNNPALTTSGGGASDVDLLITWLFNITNGAESNYKLASVIGIMIFIVVAAISLVVYNLIPSTRNEEDFS